ncbi:MAG: response regulator [Acidobacteria bacterium]|nr:response regulator [Acidobacteriota bacterium]MCB9398448.1 response regulator [Acidobacteriota bacterium]
MDLPVLIIEEDQAVRAMLQEFLEGYPLRLRCLGKVTTMSVPQFQDAVNGFVPEAVIADIQLLMDGGQKVVEWVRRLPKKPICILLSAGMPIFWSILEKSFEAVYVLEKPFSLLELVELLNTVRISANKTERLV